MVFLQNPLVESRIKVDKEQLTPEQIKLAKQKCDEVFRKGDVWIFYENDGFHRNHWTEEERINVLEMLGIKPYVSAVHKKKYAPKKKRVRNGTNRTD